MYKVVGWRDMIHSCNSKRFNTFYIFHCGPCIFFLSAAHVGEGGDYIWIYMESQRHLYSCSALLAVHYSNITSTNSKMLHLTYDMHASPMNTSIRRYICDRSIRFSFVTYELEDSISIIGSLIMIPQMVDLKRVWCHAIGRRFALMSPQCAEQNLQFSMCLEKAWGKAYLGTMTQRVK